MTAPTANLTALQYNLVIPQDADWPGVTFNLVDSNNAPADLTGCAALGEIRPSAGSDELYFTWSTSPTTGQGLLVLDTNASTLTVRVLDSESTLWTFTDAVYDIVLTNPAAPVGFRKSRVVMGSVTVSRAVTF